MAVDMFLKIKGIEGEAHDDKHKNEIDILAWSWGESQSGTMHSGGGGGAGKVNMQDLNITKYLDKATSSIMNACATGQHISDIMLTVRKAGGKSPLEFLKITLNDCLISSVSTGGSGGEDRLTENVSINFAQIKFEYKDQKADGSAGATFPFGYDLKKNKAI